MKLEGQVAIVTGGGGAICLRLADEGAMVSGVQERFGRIDILVNNAGGSVLGPKSESRKK